jgi:hypothetical protein
MPDDVVEKQYVLMNASKGRGSSYDRNGHERFPPDTTTSFTICRATEDDEEARAQHLAQLKARYSRFIKQGEFALPGAWVNGINLSSEQSGYNALLLKHAYVDDKRSRLEWIKLRAQFEIRVEDICRTMSACDLIWVVNKREVFEFTNGRADPASVRGVHPDILEEIHSRVLELNPAWEGEPDRLMTSLIKEHHLEDRVSSFKDLALKSAFATSKAVLGSLLDEINRDVFGGAGAVRGNVPLATLNRVNQPLRYLQLLNPPPENITLFYRPATESGRAAIEGFIGVIEHGKFEIKIVASRDKARDWDTDIEQVRSTLHEAVRWWLVEGTFTARDHDDMEAAADAHGLEDDYSAFRRDMDSLGLSDEDFEGRD